MFSRLGRVFLGVFATVYEIQVHSSSKYTCYSENPSTCWKVLLFLMPKTQSLVICDMYLAQTRSSGNTWTHRLDKLVDVNGV